MPRERSSALATYETLAPVYDAFTAHYDYDLFVGLVEQLARGHGLRGRRVLDLACGTGKSFGPLRDHGFQITACDISPAMLRYAAAKPDAADLRLLVADMRRLPHLGPFDSVICLDDAVNYLLTDEDFASAFASVARVLKAGGVYVFDLNTLATYRSVFASESETQHGSLKFRWRGQLTPGVDSGALCRARLDVQHEDSKGASLLVEVEHLQRHYPNHQVEAALSSAGLECVGTAGLRMDGTWDETVDELDHTKAIFIARKPKPAQPRTRRRR